MTYMEQGRQAFLAGKGRDHCPYNRTESFSGRAAFDGWQAGWEIERVRQLQEVENNKKKT